MAKLVEMVRNSPLMRRRGGGYEVLEKESKDPFAIGINFSAHYLASVEVQSKQDSPEVRDKVKQICSANASSDTAAKKSRKVCITVKSNCLQVTDVSSKVTDTYPIFLVAYCGGHPEFEDVFFFIQKTKLDQRLFAEVFKLSDEQKVRAVTMTIAKAFNIAFKAWTAQKRQRERANSGNRGSESPVPQRKSSSNGAKQSSTLATKQVGPYTPPPPRKPAEEQELGRQRSGSFGKESVLKNPAVLRVIAKNEKTGSTHDVTLTDDFDKEFQELAETRASPDVLRTSLAVDETDGFTIDAIRAFIDSQTDKEEN